ncbi:cpw-wpc domain-containing protein [Cyclospora cayetanensis]|uniref:Cpw-wpc domain-containing protein n=1 Tax=Cyclospora cayetanensis TaxID=88456 RepID=A0A1D3CS36_9EIME|nr:cpw-wpc domain-containing protein [Cyclospora cayetanensis]
MRCLLSAASQALESRGVIGSLRARLQAELFSALEEKKLYTRTAPEASEASEVQEKLMQEVQQAKEDIEETLESTPHVEQPDKEKEEKARSKGNFLTDIIEKASAIFSVLNFWYIFGAFLLFNYKSQCELDMPCNQRNYTESRQAKMCNPRSNHLQWVLMLQKTESSPLTVSEIHELEKQLPRDCVRDYSVQCPEGFVQQATDCVASDGYKGPCDKHQPELYLLSDSAKASWSWACKAKYPCMPDNCPSGTDYSQPCPLGWHAGNNAECTTADSALQCDEKITASADSTAKAKWEKTCGVRWPCKKTKCVKDYDAKCPALWSEAESGVCRAPNTYQGPCPATVDLAAYQGKAHMKRMFEKRCGVSWICRNSTLERERDFSVPCPLGWELLEDGSCRAPPSYTFTENCPKIVSFVGRRPDDRQAYATLCNVDFPFRGVGESNEIAMTHGGNDDANALITPKIYKMCQKNIDTQRLMWVAWEPKAATHMERMHPQVFLLTVKGS